MIFKDGSIYEGEYLNDQMHGQGVIRYPNGDVYAGTFMEDLKHNTGMYFYTPFFYIFFILGTYFDLTNKMKIREEYTRGKRTNFVKTPCSIEELN